MIRAARLAALILTAPGVAVRRAIETAIGQPDQWTPPHLRTLYGLDPAVPVALVTTVGQVAA